MIGQHLSHDLPAVLRPDLPARIPVRRVEVPPAAAVHAAWRTYAAQRDVRAIAVGAAGDVWLATGGGALRWHPGGERYTRYAGEHGLPGTAMTAVALDGAGRPWVLSSSRRLSVLEDDVWTPPRGLESADVTCLATAGDGRVWAAGADALWVLAAGGRAAGARIAVPDELVAAPVRALVAGDEDDVWAASAAGLFRLDEGGWSRRLADPGIVALSRQGEHLWIAGAAGLLCLDLATSHPVAIPGLPAAPAGAVAAARDGVWALVGGEPGRAGTDGWRGLGALPSGTPATSLAARPDGELWVGSAGGPWRIPAGGTPRPHLTGASPDVLGFVAEPVDDSALGNLIQALAVEPGPVVWAGTAAGLFALDAEVDRWRAVGRGSTADVRALIAADGRVWAGTWDAGVLEPAGGRLRASDGGPRGPVTALVGGSGGAVWAAGPQTVHRRDGDGGWALALNAGDLRPGASVRALAVQRDGAVLVGTSSGMLSLRGAEVDEAAGPLRQADVRALLRIGDEVLVGIRGGLYVLDAHGAHAVGDLERAEVTALAAGATRDVAWAGTAVGLWRLRRDGGEWTAVERVTAAGSGLPADRVTALSAEPGTTNLWIGTPSGIARWATGG